MADLQMMLAQKEKEMITQAKKDGRILRKRDDKRRREYVVRVDHIDLPRLREAIAIELQSVDIVDLCEASQLHIELIEAIQFGYRRLNPNTCRLIYDYFGTRILKEWMDD